QQVFEERDAPAHQRRHPPGRGAEVLQMRVPGERHEDVAGNEQQHGLQRDGQGSQPVHGYTVGTAARRCITRQNAGMRIDIPEQKKLVHEMTIPMRWGDMDAMGHMNNTVYFRYMEIARLEWLMAIGCPPDPRGEGLV